MDNFTYVCATSVAEALQAIGDGSGQQSRFLAGGTTLVDLMRLDVLHAERRWWTKYPTLLSRRALPTLPIQAGWTAGVAALLAARLLPAWSLPRNRQAAAFRGGTLVVCLGIALRQWAIAALGAFFVDEVTVRPDQPVISRGPYRWVRHPSYSYLVTNSCAP